MGRTLGYCAEWGCCAKPPRYEEIKTKFSKSIRAYYDNLTPDQKQALREARRAANPYLGKKLSDEHSKNISRALKGHKHSAETRALMSRNRKGRKRVPMSKEHRLKFGLRQRGKNNPMAKAVIIHGTRYECISDAAKLLGMNYQTLYYRLKSPLQTSYMYE